MGRDWGSTGSDGDLLGLDEQNGGRGSQREVGIDVRGRQLYAFRERWVSGGLRRWELWLGARFVLCRPTTTR